MTTTNQVQQTVRLMGNTVAFGAIASRDYSSQTLIGELKEITETIKTGDLDREFSFANFENNEAIFFFLHAKDHPVKVKINAAINQSFIIPPDGMMMLSGEGIASVFLSGQVSGNSQVYMQVAGAPIP